MPDVGSRSIPLLLPGDGRIRSAYGPTNDLASFVGHLLAKGCDLDRVPRDIRGVAALESYLGSVEGEGHEDFYGNNEEETLGIVRTALVGCEVLGLEACRAIAAEFVDVLAVDGQGRTVVERGGLQSARPQLEALDERVYGLRISDREAAGIPDRVPARYREDVERVLSRQDLYGRNPFSVEGMVWILNHPDLEWHSGPGYWDAVTKLATDPRG